LSPTEKMFDQDENEALTGAAAAGMSAVCCHCNEIYNEANNKSRRTCIQS